MAANLAFADKLFKSLLCEEKEEEVRLRRRFHLHLILIVSGLGLVFGSTVGLVPVDWAASAALSTEVCRAGIEHRTEMHHLER
jgi:hypothetical protein